MLEAILIGVAVGLMCTPVLWMIAKDMARTGWFERETRAEIFSVMASGEHRHDTECSSWDWDYDDNMDVTFYRHSRDPTGLRGIHRAVTDPYYYGIGGPTPVARIGAGDLFDVL
ncbi:MAG: hypothetical protein ACREFZ_09315 [Acetobacteraceae bacterium]